MRTSWWMLVGLLLAGCGPAVGQTLTPATTEIASKAAPEATLAPPATSTSGPAAIQEPAATATPEIAQSAPAPGGVPDVDTSKHSVPLEQVYFDTFRPVNRAVPLSRASADLILQLRDAIPPIHNPRYEAAGDAVWLNDEDAVIGYAVGDQAWAYPIRILNFHEIVNDNLAGEEVLISYCPLCYSGIVYSRELGDRTLTFGNTSALYESDMVMLDYETGSYWWQVAGEAIVGNLTGERLTVLPSRTTTWGRWKELYPQTLVLSRDTGFPRNYDRDPFSGYAEIVNSGRFAFPVSEAGQDPRLAPATEVLAVKVGDEARAYPLAALGYAASADTVGGLEIVVFTDPEVPAGVAFEPVARGQSLTLVVQDGRFVDQETGSTWDLAGRAIAGPLQGEQLPPVPARTSYWFAIIAAEPDITVYQPSTAG